MSNQANQRNLRSSFVIVDRRQRAEVMDVTDTFWRDLDTEYRETPGSRNG